MRILNDENTIKLYNCGSAFTGLNGKIDFPICSVKEFEFNKAHLKNIIPFSDL